MYLIDTNVFLEVLLFQEKREICKDFLNTNIKHLYVSDFSVHSMGVILFRNKKLDVFQRFMEDIYSNIEIVTLNKHLYKDLAKIKKIFGLDFDDAYQYKIAEEYNLEIVTLDRDFEKVKNEISIRFL